MSSPSQGWAPPPTHIRSARLAAGLSQSAAASVIYRTLRNWQQWELGERRMDRALWELFLIKTNIGLQSYGPADFESPSATGANRAD